MTKTIITVIITIIAVLFAMQNFDHVPLYFFFGKALNIRLVFVIAISGIIGYLIRLFTSMAKEEKLKKQLYLMKKRQAYANSKRVMREIDNDEI